MVPPRVTRRGMNPEGWAMAPERENLLCRKPLPQPNYLCLCFLLKGAGLIGNRPVFYAPRVGPSFSSPRSYWVGVLDEGLRPLAFGPSATGNHIVLRINWCSGQVVGGKGN